MEWTLIGGGALNLLPHATAIDRAESMGRAKEVREVEGGVGGVEGVDGGQRGRFVQAGSGFQLNYGLTIRLLDDTQTADL